MFYKKYLILATLFFYFLFIPNLVQAASLQDYWQGKASFKLLNKFSFPTDGKNSWKALNTGMDLKVVGDTWYLFTREYGFKPKPSYCKYDYARLVVRYSKDKGKTWSKKTVVIEPKKGTPYECAAADSHAYYDKSLNKWQLLYQCLDRNGWNVCYSFKKGSDPVGNYTTPNINPVVKSFQLFSKINPKVGVEGTPEFIYKDAQGFYIVTMHGYDGKNGYRGVFKTKDFINWEVLPKNPIYSKNDCNKIPFKWGSGGCVGGGQASTLYENGYYYMLIESFDKNLACSPGQNWVYNLLRTKDLSNVSWEYPPFGGILLPAYNQDNDASCGVQYARIFKDKGDTYLIVARTFRNYKYIDSDYKTGIYLYKLIKNYPEAVYSFKYIQPKDSILISDTVSQNNLVATVSSKLNWQKSILNKNKTILRVKYTSPDSFIMLPNNPLFNLKDTSSLDLRIQLDLSRVPKSGSAFIIGKPESYYLELYKDAGLCGWFWSEANKAENVCINYGSYLGDFISPGSGLHTLRLTLNNSVASLYIDDVLKASKKLSFSKLKKGGIFRVGSAKKFEKNGYFQAFTGDIYWFSFGLNSYNGTPVDFKDTFEKKPENPSDSSYKVDLDFDGKPNTLKDAIILARYLFKYPGYYCTVNSDCSSKNICINTACLPKNASFKDFPYDVNNDGKVNLIDLFYILK